MQAAEIQETSRPSEERRLLSPQAMRRALPASSEARATVHAARESLRALLHGREPRLAVIVGPCSIHDPEAALDYARRLRHLARSLAGELVVVMRTFVERPQRRLGWRGLVTDPHLDGSCDLRLGLATARQVLRRIAEIGVPCAVELREPLTQPYLEDLAAWGVVSADTRESSAHCHLASAVPFPVGFEAEGSVAEESVVAGTGTGVGSGGDADLDAALDAMAAAAVPQSFPALAPDGGCIVRETSGNPDRHLVLRGIRGGASPDAGSIAAAMRRVARHGVARPVLIDCSPGDPSGGPEPDPTRQVFACRRALDALRAGVPGLLGVMLASSLEPGRQELSRGRLRYGVSVTDPCLGWNETADLLCELADAAKRL